MDTRRWRPLAPCVNGSTAERPAHHRTTHATVAWSFELLGATHQEVFTRLGVFAGSFDLEAAERVCALDEDTVVDIVLDLAEHSLLQPVVGDPPRFTMLQAVRTFARERFDESPNRSAVEGAHSEWFTDLAVSSDEALRGKDQEWWSRRLAQDIDESPARPAPAAGSG